MIPSLFLACLPDRDLPTIHGFVRLPPYFHHFIMTCRLSSGYMCVVFLDLDLMHALQLLDKIPHVLNTRAKTLANRLLGFLI